MLKSRGSRVRGDAGLRGRTDFTDVGKWMASPYYQYFGQFWTT
jgi:hypothetical protein